MKSIIKAFEFDKKDYKIYILLLIAPILLTIYWYFGYSTSFGKFFPNLKGEELFDFYSRIYQFSAFFVLMFLIPLLIIKGVFKQSLKDFGFGFGDKKFGLVFSLLAVILLVVPLIFIASKMPEIRGEYPMSKLLLSRHDLILYYELCYVVFYYIAWEFFFRGFLLFGLKDRFGNMNAILIQTISSCLIHLGKPAGETLGAIAFGIILGAIALRTRSIWYVLIIHASVGVLTDLFVIYF